MDIHDYSTDPEGKKMGKVIFYDVDGTLFRREIRIPESTVKAIKECDRQGHKAILCTGRGACTLPAEVDDLPLHGRICQCGTYVSLNGDVLTNAGVSGPDCREILRILHEYNCPFFVENTDHYYVDPDFAPGSFKDILQVMEKNYPGKYCPVSQLPDFIQKMTGYPEDKSILPEMKEVLSPWFNVIIHDEYEYVEITLKGYTKGTGVRQILEGLGAAKDEAIAFGDSGNDIPMLEAVGLGIVMGDAPEELKARYRVTDSIYSDGIAKALIGLGLIDGAVCHIP